MKCKKGRNEDKQNEHSILQVCGIMILSVIPLLIILICLFAK